MNKEYFYVGYYFDVDGRFVLKIGTTNDLERRRKEHTRNYKRAKKYTMPASDEFLYFWHIPLSKYNTLRIEDRMREHFIQKHFGLYVANDRFVFKSPPDEITIHINKDYTVALV